MGRKSLIMFAALMSFFPTRAWTLGLEWSGGARDILVTTVASRCTLLVAPAPGGSTLPVRWRLCWTGTTEVSTAVQFLTTPIGGDAPVCRLAPPASDEDVLSHTSTVEFCGNEPGVTTSSAAYVVLIDPSVRAKFRVSAEPATIDDDTTLSEVTVNGGSAEDYPPMMARVRSMVDSTGTEYIGVVGIGMNLVQVAEVYASPDAPPVSMEIVDQSPTLLTLAMPEEGLQGSTLFLSNGAGESGGGESILDILGYDPEAAGAGAAMWPLGSLEPKDFAFLYHEGQYHLFYMWVDPTVPASLNSTDIRHAVSSNLYNWTQLPPVIPVRPGKWDNGHIWAPTIAKRGGTFYMFFTGVSSDTLGVEGVQRIGMATSTDLMTWDRRDEPVLICENNPWSYCNIAEYDGHQLRDPFVMEDPADNTKLLIYFATRLGADPNQLVIGHARAADPDLGWTESNYLECTNAYAPNWFGYCESPQVFKHGALWYLMVWVPAGIRFKHAPSPLADASQWSGQYSLAAEVQDPNTSSWIAPEYLKVGAKEYLAIANRAAVAPAIEIREFVWGTPPHFTLSAPPVTAVSERRVAGSLGLRAISRPGSPEGLQFQLELPTESDVRIEVFDLLGRSMARLHDGRLPSGTSYWQWDARSHMGAHVHSGIYFARVRTANESKAVHAVYIH